MHCAQPGADSDRSPRGELESARWARLSAEEVISIFGTSRAGLSWAEARARLDRFGPNVLPRTAHRPLQVQLATNFVHLFAVLLWVGAGLAWLAGMAPLAWAIVAVILINGLFSFWQEYQAERAVEALQALLPRQVTVQRQGEEHLVPAAAIVPGDLLLLREGQDIPADARVVQAERLRIDASSLTGESRPVPRSSNVCDVTGRTVVMLPNLLLAGTGVVSGRGEAVVFATGAATEFGRIARLAGAQRERPSPLEVELQRVTRLVTLLAVAMGASCFVAGTMLGGLSPVAGFVFAIGIIVANVPEGLLPTLTLALALGVRRMASRRALVKRLSAVETLGATTIILTDKTGTLTENEMRVREAWAGGIRVRSSRAGFEGPDSTDPAHRINGDAITDLLRIAALCCDTRPLPGGDGSRHRKTVGDPTEAAILIAAESAGLSHDRFAQWPRLAELPFDSIRKRMTTIQQIGNEAIACVKGAPSEVLPRCKSIQWRGVDLPFEGERKRAAEVATQTLSSSGLRVLAVAMRKVDRVAQGRDGWSSEDVERDLTLLGLIAMEDPPRAEVPGAIAACRKAGIRVVMVTGDDGLTAAAIGREIGLHGTPPRIVTGAELESITQDQTATLFDSEVLFARVSPEQKLRLVEACQRRGEVVAVTGDGVNDAPALKRADIGIAMGETGTDVAREAADMVLADDNFASIVGAIEEGRAVYDNVRKFVTYIFASNVPEIVPFIAFVLFRIPLPLTVMQVLAVDLGTDLVPALALGAEAPEPDVMQRRPRPRSERLLNLPTLLRAYAWLGLVEAALALGGYYFAYWIDGWRPGSPLANGGAMYITATTMSLAGIVACQVGNVFACRSSRESVRKLGLTSNRLLLVGIGVELALLLLLVYVTPLSSVFGLAPLGPRHWLVLVAFGPLLLLLEESRKAAARFVLHRRPQNVT